MKICPGTSKEVKWGPSDLPPKCTTCKNFVGYKSVDRVDGWVDVAMRHYSDGSLVNTGPRGGYRQHRSVA